MLTTLLAAPLHAAPLSHGVRVFLAVVAVGVLVFVAAFLVGAAIIASDDGRSPWPHTGGLTSWCI